MKKIRKFLLAICMILSMSSVTAYADESDYYSSMTSTYSDEDTALIYGESYMSTFAAMDETTAEYYKKNASGFIAEAAETYYDYLVNDTLGEFQELKDSKAEEIENGYSVTTTAEFEKVNLTMTLECKYINGSLTPTGLDFSMEDKNPKSLGEKLADAGLNTLIGLFTVFLILILIAYIISLFKYIPMLEEKMAKKKAAKNAELPVVENAAPQAGEPEELVDDTELVAVITAAICAATGSSSDGFVVRSIRKSKRNFD